MTAVNAFVIIFPRFNQDICNARRGCFLLDFRKSARYRLHLPAIFRWGGARGEPHVGSGFVRDISVATIFIFTNSCPPVDEIIHCDVMLPRLRNEGCTQIQASGRVSRVEFGSDPKQNGFVLVGDMLVICKEVVLGRYGGLEEIPKDEAPRLKRRVN